MISTANVPARLRFPRRAAIAALVALLAGPLLAQESCTAIESRLAAIESNPAILNLMAAGDQATLAATRLADAQAQYRNAGCETEALSGGLGATCRAFSQAVLQAQADHGALQRDASAAQGVSAERADLLARYQQAGCGSGVSFSTNGTATEQRSLLDSGGFPQSSPGFLPEAGVDLRGTRRTLCVRTCDGFYWPVSFATTQSFFAQDAQICRAQCPGAEVALYSHASTGEDTDDMVSGGGLSYARQPFAFAFRDGEVSGCGCGAAEAGFTPVGISGTFVPPTAAAPHLVDIPLPMPRPVFAGETPTAPVPQQSVPAEDLRLYQIGDDTIRVVGPVTPFAPEAEATP